MNLCALLIVAVLGLVALAPAEAKTNTPKSANAKVQRASRKSNKKFKPMKYKAPKHSKKPKSAKYGVKHA
jgi:hypothetical protein